MDSSFNLEQLNAQLEAWLLGIKGIDQQIADPQHRRLMQQAIERVRQGQVTLNAEYDKTMASVKERLEAVSRKNAETQEKAAAVRAQAAELATAPRPTAVHAPAPIDPQLGITLRDELLARYVLKPGEARGAAAAPQDFSAEYSGYEARALAEPAAAAKPPSGQPAFYVEPDIEQTPPPVIAALVQMGRITAQDVVYNLGCGDGRLLISAASKHNARGVGIDGKPTAIQAAGDNVRKARLQKLVTVEDGDPFRADVASATVVFLTLGANRNAAMVASLLRQLQHGARIVTHQASLLIGQPDEETVVRDAEGRDYRVCLWRIEGRTGAPASSITNLSGADWGSGTE